MLHGSHIAPNRICVKQTRRATSGVFTACCARVGFARDMVQVCVWRGGNEFDLGLVAVQSNAQVCRQAFHSTGRLAVNDSDRWWLLFYCSHKNIRSGFKVYINALVLICYYHFWTNSLYMDLNDECSETFIGGVSSVGALYQSDVNERPCFMEIPQHEKEQ